MSAAGRGEAGSDPLRAEAAATDANPQSTRDEGTPIFADAPLPPLSESRLTGGLRDDLRTATQAIHERIDGGIDLNVAITQRIPKDAPDLEAQRARYREVYKVFLLSVFAIELAFEEGIDRSPIARELHERLQVSSPSVPASELIERDLRTIGINPDFCKKFGQPEFPQLADIGALIGAEYVRSGSRMGGAVIAKIVNANLGFGVENGASFLNMNGRETGPRVRAFFAALDAAPLTQEERASALQAAVAVFEAVERWQREITEKLLSSSQESPVLNETVATPGSTNNVGGREDRSGRRLPSWLNRAWDWWNRRPE